MSVATCGSLLNLTPAAQQTLSFAYDSYVDSVRGLGARKWGEESIKLSATDEGAESGFLDWYLEQFEIPSTEGLCDYGDMICRKDADAHLVMKGVKVPMLLLTPKNSALVPLEDQLLLVKAAGAKMEVIPGYGHEIYLDQREACQDAYLRFLGEVGKK